MPFGGALVIAGPTASGKSGLAFELANELEVEIISADSAQVYRGMDIGTAKPDAATQARIPHHLIDIRDPADPYSAASFRSDVVKLVPQILARGRLPLIVGGTMLYLKALKEGLAEMPEAAPEVREAILAEAAEVGWAALHAELARIDPASAARIRPTDTQRLQRALEVFRVTGMSLTAFHAQQTVPCPFPLLELAIMPPDRAGLHRVIAERFEQMIAAGLVEEVARLKSDPALNPALPAMRAVGYRQVWAYLEGHYNHPTMVEKGIIATRQLAKRQYTWLRGWSDLQLLATPDKAEALKILRRGTILL
ncbi:MAG: tRNA (adenosine(37)-N6)-dimethylallyltransferase MiaA [Gammaproteobacteria bacterium]